MNRQRLAAMILSCFALTVVLVLTMISVYGDDASAVYASSSVNIHGEISPRVPSDETLEADAIEKAEQKAKQKEENVPNTGIMDTQNIILWVSLGLTVTIIIFAAASIKRMEK